jgi:phytoene dehydrogenase-like protein
MDCAPEDAVAIREFTRAIRFVARLDLPVDKPQEIYGPLDYLKMVRMLPFLRFVRKWGRIRSADLAQRFSNPLIREAFNIDAADESADMPALTIPMVLAWQHQKAAGYVIGGALALVDRVQRRYLGLGGELHLKARVDKILVQNDKAVGIRLADGTEHRGDIVISAADGHATIFDMLEGKYVDAKVRGYYDRLPLFPPLVYVGLGIARKFDEIPSSVGGLTLSLKEPVTIAGKAQRLISVLIYNFDPTLAPVGKTVVKVQFNTDFQYWERLHREPARYEAEKQRIADTVVALLDKRFPGLAAQVEMRDVATPMTWVRYTGNWKGSYEGWMLTPRTLMMQMGKTLRGLDNFYMAGQWVNPGGGMPTAVMSGRHTIQIICKRDKHRFVATTPGRRPI